MEFNFNKFSGPVNFLVTTLLGVALVYTQLNVLPFVSLFSLFAYTVLWVNQGWRWTSLSYIATSVIVYFMYGLEITLAIMPTIIILSAMIAIFIERKFDQFRTIFLAAIAFMVVTFTMLYISELQTGVSLHSAVTVIVEEQLEGFIEQLDNLPDINRDLFSTQLAMSTAMVTNTIVQNLPGVFFAAGLFMVALNYFISTSILFHGNVLKKKVLLSKLQMPKVLAIVIVAAVVITVLLEGVHPAMAIVGSNLMLIGGSLFALNGMATLGMMLKLRLVSYFLVMIFVLFFINIMIYALIFLGIVDTLVDIRSRIHFTGGPNGRQ